VDIYTDSSYVQRGITHWIGKWADRGWQRKGGDIANLALWQALHALNGQHRITWHWVRGHAGNALNERVDQLAREARLALAPKSAEPDDLVRCWLRISLTGTTGGWGALVEEGDDSRQFSGSVTRTTSNRLDLHAALEALRLTSADRPVLLCTASDYLFQGATRWLHGWKRQGWRKKDGGPVANADLWQALDQALAGRQVRWQSVKGENSAEMEIALRLATEARRTA
jgi:ribonuclease HI